MARINQAKNATSNAFIAAKRKRDELNSSGLQEANSKADVNSFEEQHHHLLSCLESATVSLLGLIFNGELVHSIN